MSKKSMPGSRARSKVFNEMGYLSWTADGEGHRRQAAFGGCEENDGTMSYASRA